MERDKEKEDRGLGVSKPTHPAIDATTTKNPSSALKTRQPTLDFQRSMIKNDKVFLVLYSRFQSEFYEDCANVL